ncbi:hypothetical protein [Caulobacter sp. 1776]|uniref:hypothetical protein n=1 Tax=Caulobacter sp. 1776 TaxID=3156420 RepID=UPI003390CE67
MAREGSGADALSGAIKGAAAIAAVVPGVAILLKVVPLPPQADQLLGGLSLVCGVAVVIAVVTLRNRIAKLKAGLAAGLVMGGCLVGVVSAVQYYNFGGAHIIAYEDVDRDGKAKSVRLIAPIHPSPELSRILDEFNGDYGEALHSPIYRSRVAGLIARENGSATWRLVTYLMLAQAFLIGALVAGAWRTAAFFEARAKAKPEGSP